MLRMILHRLKGNREVVKFHDFIDTLPEEAFIPVTAEDDLWEDLEIIFSGAPIEIVILTGTSHVVRLWQLPCQEKLYIFLTDRRINTKRLIGKPALGLSPPRFNYYSKAPAGSA